MVVLTGGLVVFLEIVVVFDHHLYFVVRVILLVMTLLVVILQCFIWLTLLFELEVILGLTGMARLLHIKHQLDLTGLLSQRILLAVLATRLRTVLALGLVI